MSHRRGQNHYRVTLPWLGLDTRGWQEIAGAYGMEKLPAGLACALSHLAKRYARTGRDAGVKDGAQGNRRRKAEPARCDMPWS